jgi:hypothetical protein
MRIYFWRILCSASIHLLFFQTGFSGAPAVLSLDTQEPPRKLIIVVAEHAGGLAVDHMRNLFVSDQGGGDEWAGTIRLHLADDVDNPVTIIRRLTRPGDIELTPDERSIVIATGSDSIPVEQIFLGISVRFEFLSGGKLSETARLYVDTDVGTLPPVAASADGFFHVLGILQPGQTTPMVTLTVQDGENVVRTFEDVGLGNESTPGLKGHRVIKLMLR